MRSVRHSARAGIIDETRARETAEQFKVFGEKFEGEFKRGFPPSDAFPNRSGEFPGRGDFNQGRPPSGFSMPPGVCNSPESCMKFCAEHPEADFAETRAIHLKKQIRTHEKENYLPMTHNALCRMAARAYRQKVFVLRKGSAQLMVAERRDIRPVTLCRRKATEVHLPQDTAALKDRPKDSCLRRGLFLRKALYINHHRAEESRLRMNLSRFKQRAQQAFSRSVRLSPEFSKHFSVCFSLLTDGPRTSP